MIDTRFYQRIGPLKLTQIANLLGLDSGPFAHLQQEINGIAPLIEGQTADLVYCETASSEAVQTDASACLISEKDANRLSGATIPIIVKSPRAAFAQIANNIIIARAFDDSSLAPPQIEDSVNIHQSAIIGQGTQIGRNTIIGPNCVIGAGVAIGRNCEIGVGCVIECALIGDGVRIGPNSVIGKSGFGVVGGATGPIDVPQFGRVIIQDNVTIGALCTVDRGAFNDTIIGLATKIDNHCHIAHNTKIGKGVVMAAFAGISGSVEIGDYVMMGGRVGVGDHFKIGNGAKIAAGSAVLSDVPAGETFAGYPAKPRMKWLREIVKLGKLTDSKN